MIQSMAHFAKFFWRKVREQLSIGALTIFTIHPEGKINRIGSYQAICVAKSITAIT